GVILYKVDSIKRGQNPTLGLLSQQKTTGKIPETYQEIMKIVGISGNYSCFTTAPEKLDESLQKFIGLGLTGINIGSPYQEKIIPWLATLSEGANMIGAVNTIVRHGQFFKGYNTNALGLMDALAATGLATAKCTSALVVGSGGAARSALFLLHWLGVPEITVAGRNLGKTENVTSYLGGGQPMLLKDALEKTKTAEIIINATTVSNTKADSELAQQLELMPLTGCRMVVDFNYDEQDNIWHELAQSQSCSFLDGTTLLAYQTRHALTLWTGQQIPLTAVSEALQKISDLP
ncbi:MAG: hypothetical protein J7M09_05250, partial [Deltaproteobacteria bacterium]|nr:hypothetical protein [Candidatus Tharpella sp.]